MIDLTTDDIRTQILSHPEVFLIHRMENTVKKSGTEDHEDRKHAPEHRKPIHQVVPVDETRTRVGEKAGALGIETGEGIDDLGEDLGESFVKNVTGADDAAMKERGEDLAEDEDGK